jgi:hypothetical protein
MSECLMRDRPGEALVQPEQDLVPTLGEERVVGHVVMVCRHGVHDQVQLSGMSRHVALVRGRDQVVRAQRPRQLLGGRARDDGDPSAQRLGDFDSHLRQPPKLDDAHGGALPQARERRQARAALCCRRPTALSSRSCWPASRATTRPGCARTARRWIRWAACLALPRKRCSPSWARCASSTWRNCARTRSSAASTASWCGTWTWRGAGRCAPWPRARWCATRASGRAASTCSTRAAGTATCSRSARRGTSSNTRSSAHPTSSARPRGAPSRRSRRDGLPSSAPSRSNRASAASPFTRAKRCGSAATSRTPSRTTASTSRSTVACWKMASRS